MKHLQNGGLKKKNEASRNRKDGQRIQHGGIECNPKTIPASTWHKTQ